MLKAVFDAAVLVSAFLTPNGVSDQLLRLCRQGAFTLYFSTALIEETQRTLLADAKIRKRFPYADGDVHDFVTKVQRAAQPVLALPPVTGVCRDPNDDHVIACALGAGASYLVTRDKDLLTLETYQTVEMIRPEEFIHIVREQASKP